MELSRREALIAMVGATATLAAPKLLRAQTLTTEKNAGWDNIASQFLIRPELAYLNTGALGATPKSVLQTVMDATYSLEQNPAANQYEIMVEQVYAAKQTIANYINCSIDDLVMTAGTTDGITQILDGLQLAPNQRVLISSLEYHRLHEYWEHYSRTHNTKLDVVEIPLLPRDKDEIIERIKAAIKPDTAVIFLSHVASANGLQMPIAEIAPIARRNHCLLVVDGAQAVGAVKTDMKALGCDIYAASGHKWLLGPKGTGFLYISEQARSKLSSPSLTNGYGKRTNSISVQNLPNIIGLGASITWLNQLGQSKVQTRLENLRSIIYTKLQAIKGVKLMSPPAESGMASPMVALAFSDKSKSPNLCVQAFAKANIIVKKVEGYNGIIDLRIGGHIYNSEAQIERFSNLVTKFC